MRVLGAISGGRLRPYRWVMPPAPAPLGPPPFVSALPPAQPPPARPPCELLLASAEPALPESASRLDDPTRAYYMFAYASDERRQHESCAAAGSDYGR
jgi:hypothetical protein